MGTLKDSREGLASSELDLAIEKYQFLNLFLEASVVNGFDVFRASRRQNEARNVKQFFDIFEPELAVQ